MHLLSCIILKRKVPYTNHALHLLSIVCQIRSAMSDNFATFIAFLDHLLWLLSVISCGTSWPAFMANLKNKYLYMIAECCNEIIRIVVYWIKIQQTRMMADFF